MKCSKLYTPLPIASLHLPVSIYPWLSHRAKLQLKALAADEMSANCQRSQLRTTRRMCNASFWMPAFRYVLHTKCIRVSGTCIAASETFSSVWSHSWKSLELTTFEHWILRHFHYPRGFAFLFIFCVLCHFYCYWLKSMKFVSCLYLLRKCCGTGRAGNRIYFNFRERVRYWLVIFWLPLFNNTFYYWWKAFI